MTAPFTSPNVGYHAIGTIIVAALHHGDIATDLMCISRYGVLPGFVDAIRFGDVDYPDAAVFHF